MAIWANILLPLEPPRLLSQTPIPAPRRMEMMLVRSRVQITSLVKMPFFFLPFDDGFFISLISSSKCTLGCCLLALDVDDDDEDDDFRLRQTFDAELSFELEPVDRDSLDGRLGLDDQSQTMSDSIPANALM